MNSQSSWERTCSYMLPLRHTQSPQLAKFQEETLNPGIITLRQSYHMARDTEMPGGVCCLPHKSSHRGKRRFFNRNQVTSVSALALPWSGLSLPGTVRCNSQSGVPMPKTAWITRSLGIPTPTPGISWPQKDGSMKGTTHYPLPSTRIATGITWSTPSLPTSREYFSREEARPHVCSPEVCPPLAGTAVGLPTGQSRQSEHWNLQEQGWSPWGCATHTPHTQDMFTCLCHLLPSLHTLPLCNNLDLNFYLFLDSKIPSPTIHSAPAILLPVEWEKIFANYVTDKR